MSSSTGNVPHSAVVAEGSSIPVTGVPVDIEKENRKREKAEAQKRKIDAISVIIDENTSSQEKETVRDALDNGVVQTAKDVIACAQHFAKQYLQLEKSFVEAHAIFDKLSNDGGLLQTGKLVAGMHGSKPTKLIKQLDHATEKARKAISVAQEKFKQASEKQWKVPIGGMLKLVRNVGATVRDMSSAFYQLEGGATWSLTEEEEAAVMEMRRNKRMKKSDDLADAAPAPVESTTPDNGEDSVSEVSDMESELNE